MAITYKDWDFMPGQKIPVLHKVIYAHTTCGLPAHMQRSYKDYLVDEWLKENCRSSYYHSPGYLQEKFIQFEDDEEAMWFALRWGISNNEV